LNVVVVSLDDFYHRHEDLVAFHESNSTNKLLQTRGQPGTHDEKLAQDFFGSIESRQSEIRIPRFDKSCFNGEGDRVPREEWEVASNDPPIDVVIFEGWCVGFSALHESVVKSRWEASQRQKHETGDHADTEFSTNTLCNHALADLLAINTNLKRYNKTFMKPTSFSYLILLDTDELANVYAWRLDQEHALRARTCCGMSDEAVIGFVKGYMPAYELYLEKLQRESFVPRKLEDMWRSTQMRITLDRERCVVRIEEMY
jgi:D-glycerate 3-kinase